MVVSIRQRVVLASAPLLLLICAPLALGLPAHLDSLSLQWMESRAVGIAKALGGAVQAADFDGPMAATLELSGLASTPDAVYGQMVDAEGRSLGMWGRVPASKPPVTVADPVRYGDGLLHVAAASETRTGAAGTLVAGFSLAEYQARGRQARIWAGAIAASVLGVGLLSTWLLASYLVRPLVRVTAVARRIEAGDEAAANDLPRTGDEVGTMAAALGRTFEELRLQRVRVAEVNRDLAAVVDDRTEELVRTNVALADLRLAQEQLVVADRRSSLGRLAAGVGHTINNPLAYVSGNLDWVREELKSVQEELVASGRATPVEIDRLNALCAALLDASEGASRIKAIVSQLRTFSGGGLQERLEPIRLTDALDVALALLEHELKHRARLEREDLGAPPVRANLTQLSQVFVNLLVNAAHAIANLPEGRNVIRARVGTDPEGRAYAEIEDTGCGLSPEDRARLFTPFFTTKPVGEGTGLGLSVSLGIVRSFGGHITVESEPDRGSRFRVVLPACAELPVAPALFAASATLPSGQGARILIVDDEPAVADSLARLLARRHQPLTASSGREVLDRIARGERYDVIVCDLMMPSMNGMEVYASLKADAPDQAARMIFITGGAFTEAGRQFLQEMEGRWLSKPLDTALLNRLVDARLASRGG